MERRSFVTALGFAALTAPASAASEKPAKPAPQEVRPKQSYAALARSSSICLAAGQNCLRRALAALATKDVALADCANSAADVVAACDGVWNNLRGITPKYNR